MYLELNNKNIYKYFSEHEIKRINQNIKKSLNKYFLSMSLCDFISIIDNENKTWLILNIQFVYLHIYIKFSNTIIRMKINKYNNYNDIKIYYMENLFTKYYIDIKNDIYVKYQFNILNIHKQNYFQKIISLNFKFISINNHNIKYYSKPSKTFISVNKIYNINRKINLNGINTNYYYRYNYIYILILTYNKYTLNYKLNNKLFNLYIFE